MVLVQDECMSRSRVRVRLVVEWRILEDWQCVWEMIGNGWFGMGWDWDWTGLGKRRNEGEPRKRAKQSKVTLE